MAFPLFGKKPKAALEGVKLTGSAPGTSLAIPAFGTGSRPKLGGSKPGLGSGPETFEGQYRVVDEGDEFLGQEIPYEEGEETTSGPPLGGDGGQGRVHRGFGKVFGKWFKGRGKKVGDFAKDDFRRTAKDAKGAAKTGWEYGKKGVGYAEKGADWYGKAGEKAAESTVGFVGKKVKDQYKKQRERSKEEKEFWERQYQASGSDLPPSMRKEAKKSSERAFRHGRQVKEEAAELGISTGGLKSIEQLRAEVAVVIGIEVTDKRLKDPQRVRILAEQAGIPLQGEKSVAQLEREILAIKQSSAGSRVQTLHLEQVEEELNPLIGKKTRRAKKYVEGAAGIAGGVSKGISAMGGSGRGRSRNKIREAGFGGGRLGSLHQGGVSGNPAYANPFAGPEASRMNPTGGTRINPAGGGEKLRQAGISGPRPGGGGGTVGNILGSSKIGRIDPASGGGRFANTGTRVAKGPRYGSRKLRIL